MKIKVDYDPGLKESTYTIKLSKHELERLDLTPSQRRALGFCLSGWTGGTYRLMGLVFVAMQLDKSNHDGLREMAAKMNGDNDAKSF